MSAGRKEFPPILDIRESLAVLAVLAAIPSNCLAATALADLSQPAMILRANRRGGDKPHRCPSGTASAWTA
jgi:hypothetical protein